MFKSTNAKDLEKEIEQLKKRLGEREYKFEPYYNYTWEGARTLTEILKPKEQKL